MTTEKIQASDMTQSEEPILELDSLSVEYTTDEGSVRALNNISTQVKKGETLGIAGESGSGKSTLAFAILQALDDNGRVTEGSIKFKGESMNEMSDKKVQSLRGHKIAHVPQDPRTSLNPSMTVGEQIAETVRYKLGYSKKEARKRAIEMLDQVEISDPEYNADRYPHELSGGMQQRVLVAIALSCEPEVLILDEPTTGLDVTTEAKILDLIDELKEDVDASIIVITHNLGVIAELADQVDILYAGEMMEQGDLDDVFNNPTNPYTQGLLAALPRTDMDMELVSIPGQIPDLIDKPDGCVFADRCQFAEEACTNGQIDMEKIPEESGHQVRCRRWQTAREDPIEPEERSTQRQVSNNATDIIEVEDAKKFFDQPSFFDSLLDRGKPIKAVNGVDLDITSSQTLGLVGESGSGKSTLGRVLLQLLDQTEGKVMYRGKDISKFNKSELKEFRSESQIVFQNPRSSLNPRKTVYEEIVRPVKKFTNIDKSERKETVVEMLNEVELGPEYLDRYPHELSGGEQQRVAVARAFVADPSFVVLDEPVSALDVSVQASILNLLDRLSDEYDSAYLFISHDLGVVKYISDRIAVMYLGEIVETGSKEDVFSPPYHPYTRALLSSIPSPDPDKDKERLHLEGDVPSPRDPPSGCPFHTRCPQKIGDVCEKEVPHLEEVEMADGETHQIACHLDVEEMSEETENLKKQSDD